MFPIYAEHQIEIKNEIGGSVEIVRLRERLALVLNTFTLNHKHSANTNYSTLKILRTFISKMFIHHGRELTCLFLHEEWSVSWVEVTGSKPDELKEPTNTIWQREWQGTQPIKTYTKIPGISKFG